MQIHRERFEAWLFSQPDDRLYDFLNVKDCVICQFLKETTSLKVNFATIETIETSCGDMQIPNWFSGGERTYEGFSKQLMFTGLIGSSGLYKVLKDRYITLFGNPLTEPQPSDTIPKSDYQTVT